MSKKVSGGLDFEVDDLTSSIVNVKSGDSFPTNVLTLKNSDLKSITKKKGWIFNWRTELKHPERDIFKLTITNNTNVIQGLVSLEAKADHIYMHLLENSPFNRGKNKVYSGVPGNLVAFACKLSFQRGFEGNVVFISKTALIEHYIETLGAYHFSGRLMVIQTKAAKNLVSKYFSNLN